MDLFGQHRERKAIRFWRRWTDVSLNEMELRKQSYKANARVWFSYINFQVPFRCAFGSYRFRNLDVKLVRNQEAIN